MKPAVYQRAGSSDCPGVPALLGGECQCGYVFFPWQTYGCENCGAFGDDLAPRLLSGTGRLVGKAPVHLHAGKREAPFTVVAVALKDGPVVRSLLMGEECRTGAMVETCLVPVTNPETDKPALDLRFRCLAEGDAK